MNGTSLYRMMRTDGSKPVLLSTLRQVAEALDTAHRSGTVHGVLTPADIIVAPAEDDNVTVQIVNFGQVKAFAQDLTSGGAPPEAANYMSREQILGTTVDARSDQFSLAVIAYELVTGRKPFQGDNLPTLFYEICTVTPEPAQKLNLGLSARVGDVLNRALAKNPDERFATCSEFIGALAPALAQSPEWVPGPKLQAVRGATAGTFEKRPDPLAAATTVGHEAPEKPQPEPIRAAAADTAAAGAPGTPELPRISRRPRRAYDDDDEGSRPSPGSSVTRFGLIAGALLLIAALAIFIIRPKVRPNMPAQVLDTRAGPTSAPPTLDQSQPTKDLTHQQSTAADKSPATSNPPEQTPRPRHANSNRQTAPTPPTSGPAPDQGMPTNALADIDLLSEPPGAQMVVDNRPDRTCTAPCTLSLSTGRHTLSTHLPGYTPAQRIFNVPQDNSVFVALDRTTGTLVLTSIPPGSTIVVDGRNSGHTPATLHLTPGDHRIELINGSQRHQETINVEPDTLQARSFDWRQ
ncbi:MAG: PEGA domain-containing protein [Acidobacteriaceae bacterium]|nr:PEGA domain-containing protein [Acidobacteriaceae bacterium]